MAASSLYKNNSVFGAHLRRMKARMGPVEAITATAHKMARTIYYMMLRGEDFHDSGGDFMINLTVKKHSNFSKKRAESMGYSLEKMESQTADIQ